MVIMPSASTLLDAIWQVLGDAAIELERVSGDPALRSRLRQLASDLALVDVTPWMSDDRRATLNVSAVNEARVLASDAAAAIADYRGTVARYQDD